jgi:hypothetical protein
MSDAATRLARAAEIQALSDWLTRFDGWSAEKWSVETIESTPHLRRAKRALDRYNALIDEMIE